LLMLVGQLIELGLVVVVAAAAAVVAVRVDMVELLGNYDAYLQNH